MCAKSRSDPTIRLVQVSPLSINLGGLTMMLGALLYIWALLRFNLQSGQYIYMAVWACIAFSAYQLKRNRITIDSVKRELSVQGYWCFLFDEKEVVYGFDALRQKVIETDSGRILTLFCPDGNRVAIYVDPALEILCDVISNESRPRI